MHRRRLLKALGATAGVGVLGGCSQVAREEETTETTTPATTTESATVSRSNFGSVVNVGDMDIDLSDDVSLDSLFERLAGDDTLMILPEGRYTIDRVLDMRELTNFGLVAADGATPTLVPTVDTEGLSGSDGVLMWLEGRDLSLGGFTLDFTQQGYGGQIVVTARAGDFTLYDIQTKGQLAGNIDGYRVECHDPDGVGVIENIRMRDGAREGPSATGIQVGIKHAGELHITDCDLWHFPSKGIYASPPASAAGSGGTIHVNGGLFKNNNDCDVRIGSAGSTIKNIVSVKEDTTQGENVTWERPIPYRHWKIDGEWERDIIQARSIRLKNGRDVLIEGCEFRHEIGGGAGVITAENSHNGGTTIRDCQIHVENAEINPILLRGGKNSFDVEGVTITGSPKNRAGIHIEAGRRGTTLTDCQIHLSAGDAVKLTNARDCRLSGVDFEVPGSHITFEKPGEETTEPTATTPTAKPPKDHTVHVRASGANAVSYRLEVSGAIDPITTGTTVEPGSDTVAAVLNDATEAYEFSGDIVDLRISRPGTAVIDA